MKFSSKEHFPQLLSCNVCFYPPYKPRISVCQCDMLFCLICIRNQKNLNSCAICRWRFEYQQLPETYKYILENVLIKCTNCSEYQPALKYKRHEIQCQQRKELLNVQQTMQRQIQVSFLSQIEQLQKIQRKPLILSEIELNELSQTLYTCNMCFQEFDGIIIQSHIQVCIEQKVSCEMENCQWIGIRKNFTQHLKSCSQNQIIKNNKEINQLELANFILSRNQFLNSSEGQTIDRKIIILLHMNQDTEIPMETPQRNSFLQQTQSFLYSDQ